MAHDWQYLFKSTQGDIMRPTIFLGLIIVSSLAWAQVRKEQTLKVVSCSDANTVYNIGFTIKNPTSDSFSLRGLLSKYDYSSSNGHSKMNKNPLVYSSADAYKAALTFFSTVQEAKAYIEENNIFLHGQNETVVLNVKTNSLMNLQTGKTLRCD